jgi:ketosteroid isomerase-like protein
MEQKWSRAEKEIWETVKAYWQATDVDSLMAYVHSEFVGWNVNDPMPHNNTVVHAMLANELDNRDIIFTKISPTGLKIHDNIAVVNYYFNILYKNIDGDQQVEKGRFTDILKKDDGKWLLIADHGGANTPIDD